MSIPLEKAESSRLHPDRELKKTDILSSQTAEKMMAEKLGLTMRVVAPKDIALIGLRDGTYNNHFASSGNIGVERTDVALRMKGVDIGFVSSVVDTTTGKKTGKITMISIAEALRGKNLGSLAFCYAGIRNLEEGVQELTNFEADETGRIRRLNTDLGFVKTGGKIRLEDTPEWKLDISAENKTAVQEIFSSKFIDALNKAKKADLDFDPKVVDRDNPVREAIIESLYNKFGTELIIDQGKDVLYGYDGAPVKIYMEGGSLVMRVRNRDGNVFRRFEDMGFDIFPYPSDRLIDGYEIYGQPKIPMKNLSEAVRYFAQQGQELFEQSQSAQAA